MQEDPHDGSALRAAEATLARVARSVEAAEGGMITAAEAVDQILDELAARPALGRVREALHRSFSPASTH